MYLDQLKRLYRYHYESGLEQESESIREDIKPCKTWVFLKVKYTPETDTFLIEKNEYKFYQNPRNSKYYVTWRTRRGITELMIISDEEYKSVTMGGHIERDQYR